MELRRYGRGYLPHVEGRGLTQFVTWRLADAIPYDLLLEWENERDAHNTAESKQLFYRRVESYLDEGHGCQLLRHPRAAGIVQQALIHYHRRRIALHAWTVMPTHVHALFTLLGNESLKNVMKDMKGFTAREINKALARTGQLWQEDYFDRFIRDEEHHGRVAHYIEWNAVKAKLCSDPKLWSYSSSCPETALRAFRDSEVPEPGCGLGGPRSV